MIDVFSIEKHYECLRKWTIITGYLAVIVSIVVIILNAILEKVIAFYILPPFFILLIGLDLKLLFQTKENIVLYMLGPAIFLICSLVLSLVACIVFVIMLSITFNDETMTGS